MTLVAGIDVGSGRTKAVLVDESGQIVAASEGRTYLPFEAAAREAFGEALRQAAASQADYVAATGLGRHSIGFHDVTITEITCGARGGYELDPEARFVLDIGAQCTRAIRLRERGRVAQFQTNEKCAAGSGSFLERVARYLEMPLEELGEISLAAERGRPISSICAVLAESEIINHVTEGVPVAQIVRGVHESLAGRALNQLRRVGLDGPVLLIGGVARQRGMVEACGRTFEVPVRVHPRSPWATALGAALLGLRRLQRLHQRA